MKGSYEIKKLYGGAGRGYGGGGRICLNFFVSILKEVVKVYIANVILCVTQKKKPLMILIFLLWDLPSSIL